jgi:tetratricopeptide (TPR) repeat protein
MLWCFQENKGNIILNKTLPVITCILFATNTLQSQESNHEVPVIIDSLHSLWKQNPKRAIRYAQDILVNKENIDKELESKIHHVLGKIYVDLDLPSLSFLHFNESTQKSIAKNQPWNLIGIGNVYNKAGNFLQAKEKYTSAVENKRYRLRKKLALKKETKLDVFIHGLDIQIV